MSSKPAHKPRGLYFEQFNEGDTIVTANRTITETDIVNFAGVSGDFTALHTDDLFAQTTPFGKRVAHGMLVQSIATGLAAQLGILEGTILAFRELECKFSQPIFIGDTIRVQLEVTGKKAFRRLGGGNIFLKVNVINQADEVVQRGQWTMLIQSQPTDNE
ncbi:MAG TPA: MaoC/PaaZ C-terminal domain-containing protein [Anaerolineae bacterium]|nr:MaoC/PaaZ C-terminal domain-containing protein [Anaerolineae bacterium]